MRSLQTAKAEESGNARCPRIRRSRLQKSLTGLAQASTNPHRFNIFRPLAALPPSTAIRDSGVLDRGPRDETADPASGITTASHVARCLRLRASNGRLSASERAATSHCAQLTELTPRRNTLPARSRSQCRDRAPHPSMMRRKRSMPGTSLLETWVEDCAKLTRPDQIVWCDGSEAEYRTLVENMLKTGEFIAVNEEAYPNSYLHRSSPTDVARTEAPHLYLHAARGRRRTHQQLDGARRGQGDAPTPLRRLHARAHDVRRTLL